MMCITYWSVVRTKSLYSVQVDSNKEGMALNSLPLSPRHSHRPNTIVYVSSTLPLVPNLFPGRKKKRKKAAQSRKNDGLSRDSNPGPVT